MHLLLVSVSAKWTRNNTDKNKYSMTNHDEKDKRVWESSIQEGEQA